MQVFDVVVLGAGSAGEWVAGGVADQGGAGRMDAVVDELLLARPDQPRLPGPGLPPRPGSADRPARPGE